MEHAVNQPDGRYPARERQNRTRIGVHGIASNIAWAAIPFSNRVCSRGDVLLAIYDQYREPTQREADECTFPFDRRTGHALSRVGMLCVGQ